MPKRGDKEFVKDIKEAIERIKSYTGKMAYEQFLQDTKTQDAVVRNIEIIGEAVKNISKGLREKYKNIEWKKISGLRDKIIHYYFGVNWDILWDVIQKQIPRLKVQIEGILKEIS